MCRSVFNLKVLVGVFALLGAIGCPIAPLKSLYAQGVEDYRIVAEFREGFTSDRDLVPAKLQSHLRGLTGGELIHVTAVGLDQVEVSNIPAGFRELVKAEVFKFQYRTHTVFGSVDEVGDRNRIEYPFPASELPIVYQPGVDVTGVQIEIDGEVLEGMHPFELMAFQRAISTAASQLYVVSNPQPGEARPKLSFSARQGPILTLDDMREQQQRTGGGDGDYQEIGDDLRPQQFDQILDEGRLVVNPEFGNQERVYFFGELYISGNSRIMISLKRGFQRASYVVRVGIPRTFLPEDSEAWQSMAPLYDFADRARRLEDRDNRNEVEFDELQRPNLVRSFGHVLKSASEIVDLLVGIPLTNARHSDSEVDALVDARAKNQARERLVISVGQEADLRLFEPGFVQAMSPILYDVHEQANEHWDDIEESVVDEVIRLVSFGSLEQINHLRRKFSHLLETSNVDSGVWREALRESTRDLPGLWEEVVSDERLRDAADLIAQLKQANLYGFMIQSAELEDLSVTLDEGEDTERTIKAEGIAFRLIQNAQAHRIIIAGEIELKEKREAEYLKILRELRDQNPRRAANEFYLEDDWFRDQASKRLLAWHQGELVAHITRIEGKLLQSGLANEAVVYSAMSSYYLGKDKGLKDHAKLAKQRVAARTYVFPFPKIFNSNWNVTQAPEGDFYQSPPVDVEVSSAIWGRRWATFFVRIGSFWKVGTRGLVQAMINGPEFVGMKALGGRYSNESYVDKKSGRILPRGKVWDEDAQKAVWKGVRRHPETNELARSGQWWIYNEQLGAYREEYDPRREGWLSRSIAFFEKTSERIEETNSPGYQSRSGFPPAVMKAWYSAWGYLVLGVGWNAIRGTAQLATTATLLTTMSALAISSPIWATMGSAWASLMTGVHDFQDRDQEVSPWYTAKQLIFMSAALGVTVYGSPFVSSFFNFVGRSLDRIPGVLGDVLGFGSTPAWLGVAALGVTAFVASEWIQVSTSRRSRRNFWSTLRPLRSLFYRTGLAGVGQAAVLVPGKLVFHDALYAVAGGVVGNPIRSAARWLRDRVVYKIIVKPIAPLRWVGVTSMVVPEPGSNTKGILGQLLRQTKGPGTDSQFFRQLTDLDKAKLLLQLENEITALEFFRDRAEFYLTSAPEDALRSWKEEMSRHIMALANAGLPIGRLVSSILEDHRIKNLEILDEALSAYEDLLQNIRNFSREIRGEVKMSSEGLASLRALAEDQSRIYFSDLLGSYNGRDQTEFFKRWGLDLGDYQGLTTALMSEALGSEVLSPFDEGASSEETHDMESDDDMTDYMWRRLTAQAPRIDRTGGENLDEFREWVRGGHGAVNPRTEVFVGAQRSCDVSLLSAARIASFGD